MRRSLFLLMTLLCLAPISITRADDSADLRAENARLRTQLEALQKSCPVAAANPVAAPSPPSTSAVAADATIVAAPVAALAAESRQSVPATPAADIAPAVAPPVPPPPPPGYKLVRVAPLAPSERYLDTGCSQGFLKGPPPAKWLDVSVWDGLQKDMTPPQVEALIGIDHHDVNARGKLQWQYGRCGDMVSGWVLFEDGRVRSWSAPER
jgi:hypothetical protein